MRYLLLLLITFSVNTFAACTGQYISARDICWSCIFPITIGAVVKQASANFDDTENPSQTYCQCGSTTGMTLGFWEPIGLVDVTRTPFCLVNLGGHQMLDQQNTGMGTVARDSAFYYVHWYKAPYIAIMSKLLDFNPGSNCLDKGSVPELQYLSELDATWRDDSLAFITYPEAVVFGTTVAQLACAEDTYKTFSGTPVDSLFWCAGGQGSMYPLTGSVQNYSSGVQASVLLTERMVYKLHRDLLLEDSTPANVCTLIKHPLMPKSRYRYQMVNPIPTTSGGAYPFGYTTTLWEASHQFPMKGEDFGYLVWRKRNCCSNTIR